MRKITVPVAFAAVAVLLTITLMSMLSKRKIYNEGRDEWAYKGGKNPAW